MSLKAVVSIFLIKNYSLFVSIIWYLFLLLLQMRITFFYGGWEKISRTEAIFQLRI